MHKFGFSPQNADNPSDMRDDGGAILGPAMLLVIIPPTVLSIYYETVKFFLIMKASWEQEADGNKNILYKS